MGEGKFSQLRAFILIFFMMAQPLVASEAFQTQSPASSSATFEIKPRPSKLKRFFLKPMKYLALTACGLTLGSSLYHDLQAKSQGYEHIGSGIYLDLERIDSLIPPAKKDWIDAASTERDRVLRTATLYSELLADDFDMKAEWPKFFQKSQLASSYIKGQCDKRGVCRHKTMILAEILRHKGIQAVGIARMGSHMSWHAWVYLPDYRLVLDPVNHPGEVTAVDEYLKETFASDSGHWIDFTSSIPFYLNRNLGGIVR